LPFGIINALFLVREVDDLGQGCTGPRCSTHYHRTTFYVLLLVLLTSVACFMYKLMRSLTLTELWEERNQLRSIEAELAERARRLEMSALGPEGVESDSESDSDNDSDSGRTRSLASSEDFLTIVVTAISHEALERDSARPTPKTVVQSLSTFETALLPECGR
jgi:hypothetical protein